MPLDRDNVREGVLSWDDIRDGYRQLEIDHVLTPSVKLTLRTIMLRLQALLDDGVDSYLTGEPLAEIIATTIDEIANDLGVVAAEIDQGPNTDATDKYSNR